MSSSQHPSPAQLAGPRTLAPRLLVGGGIVLVLLATLALWWRFGPSVFVDALGSVWTCL